jgi:type II secretory pathway pseudopilin PulG
MTGRRSSRGGHTLTEMLIAMIVMGVIGVSLTKLIVTEGRSFDRQAAAQQARAVTRESLNYLQSDLHMVEASGGITAASPTSITVRVPYALGVACSATTISTLPVDSMTYANARFVGYAWRDTTGAYNYQDPATSVAVGVAATCTAASITTLSGGLVLAVAPAMPAGALVGTNVMLFQKITYSFGPSGLIPGRWGLFRTSLPNGTAEEVAAPLDSAASRFAYFNLNSDTAQTTVPTLSNIRGIELRLTGQSTTIPRGYTTYLESQLTTAIFFANRMN